MTTMITAIMTCLGMTITNVAAIVLSNKKFQAVTDTKIEELTREVREHNNFAKRMPVVEEQIKRIKDDMLELKKGR